MEESIKSAIKSKEIKRRYDDYSNKRKRSIRASLDEMATVINSTVEVKSTIREEQHKCITTSHGHGFISVIGRRRVMEDAVKVVPGFVAAEEGGFDFFGVYDGHGGTMVANACRDRLHVLLAEEVKDRVGGRGEEKELDWHKVMFSCFMKMDQEIGVDGCGGDQGEDCSNMDGNTMGSTAAVLVVGKEELVVANCGDSRAVLSRGGEALPLSRDHKPDRPDEKQRIEAAGGRVINWNGNRVLGVLATSRSIGDHCMKPFVISQPEIDVYPRRESDEFVVVASDGLWDVVTNNFACEVVRGCLEGHMRKNFREDLSHTAEAAALLAELAMARGSEDNISVIVIQLKGLSLHSDL